jgi:hypothetical protein
LEAYKELGRHTGKEAEAAAWVEESLAGLEGIKAKVVNMLVVVLLWEMGVDGLVYSFIRGVCFLDERDQSVADSTRRAHLQQVNEHMRGRPPIKVAFFEWIEPIYAAGACVCLFIFPLDE